MQKNIPNIKNRSMMVLLVVAIIASLVLSVVSVPMNQAKAAGTPIDSVLMPTAISPPMRGFPC